MRASRLSAPRRSTRPWLPVTSTIVEASPPGEVPALLWFLRVCASQGVSWYGDLTTAMYGRDPYNNLSARRAARATPSVSDSSEG